MTAILNQRFYNPFSVLTQVSDGVDQATEMYYMAKTAFTGLTIAAAGSVLLLGAVAGGLLEGVALINARELGESEETHAKALKSACVVIGLLGALAVTVNLGVFVGFLANTGLTYLTTGELVYGGTTLIVGCATGVIFALGTLAIHWKAFQWAGLVHAPDQLNTRE